MVVGARGLARNLARSDLPLMASSRSDRPDVISKLSFPYVGRLDRLGDDSSNLLQAPAPTKLATPENFFSQY